DESAYGPAFSTAFCEAHWDTQQTAELTAVAATLESADESDRATYFAAFNSNGTAFFPANTCSHQRHAGTDPTDDATYTTALEQANFEADRSAYWQSQQSPECAAIVDSIFPAYSRT
ncbi:MAG: hypothetical protein EBZ77_16080, partial [Chitinophagia bacterium]|nr:hypothetical protein [Chitinophagia bacterium]